MKHIIISITVAYFLMGCNDKTVIQDTSSAIASSQEKADVSTPTCYNLTNDICELNLYLIEKANNGYKFKLEYKSPGFQKTFSGQANLVTIMNDEGNLTLPEGSFILDSKSGTEYICDSTFSFEAKGLILSFGIEKDSKSRVSLNLYQSEIEEIPNQEQTLHKK